MDEPDADASRRKAAEAARDAAIRSLAANLVSLGLMIGFSLALARRDALARTWAGVRARVRPPGRQWREDAAVAELRADLSRMEHEGMGIP